MRSFVNSSLVFGIASLAASVAAGTNSTIPMQVRLAYAGPTGMTVSWNTFSKLSNPTVHYGLSSQSLNLTASSNVSVTYLTSTTFNNHVEITGLQPSTKYFYQPQDSNVTTPYSFTTSRAAGDGASFSVAVVVDLGLIGPDGLSTSVGKGAANPLSPGEQNTIQSLTQSMGTFDHLFHDGDIAYADYWLKESVQQYLNVSIDQGVAAYENLLNEFYDQMSPITALVPYMVSPGNHEADCDNGGTTDKIHNITYTVSLCMPGQTNFTGYVNHFRMPSAQSNGTGNFWYSYDEGMTHFVVIDTETDIGQGRIGPDEVGGADGPQNAGPFGTARDAQLQWLDSDLSAVDRTITPWVVVMGHRPMYGSIGTDPSTLCDDCRLSFEPIFNKHGVDVVYSGHAHNVERMTPVNNYTVDPKGLQNPTAPWYLRNGAGGHYDGLDPLVTPVLNFSNYAADTEYSWSKLIFHNCTHMTNQFIASRNGSVLDSATLFKDRTCNFIAKNVTGMGNATTTTSGSYPVATGEARSLRYKMATLVGMLAVVGLAVY